MDDKLANAMINAVARQREQALNVNFQLEAQLELVTAELAEAKAALAKREDGETPASHLGNGLSGSIAVRPQ